MARSEASRPPAVERLLAAVRPRLAGERDHDALVVAAQDGDRRRACPTRRRRGSPSAVRPCR